MRRPKRNSSSGEYNPIWLTEKEYQKLVDRFGKEDTDDKIDEFSKLGEFFNLKKFLFVSFLKILWNQRGVFYIL